MDRRSNGWRADGAAHALGAGAWGGDRYARVEGGGGLHLPRQVGVRLGVEQQPRHLDVAELRGQVEPRGAVLRGAVVRRGAGRAGEVGQGMGPRGDVRGGVRDRCGGQIFDQ